MHITALENANLFFKTYLGPSLPQGYRVVEIGAQDVNGSLRSVSPPGVDYVGLDFVSGKGVDIVLDDPYVLPFADGSVDCCVSSSVFEHSEMFWVLFLEIMRILKPAGLFYMNAPSNGVFHRYPVDCWRFYPDSGAALVKWAGRSGFDSALLESYTSFQKNDVWNDYVAVFIKDRSMASMYPQRILDTFKNFTNGQVFGNEKLINPKSAPEDQLKLEAIGSIVTRKITVR